MDEWKRFANAAVQEELIAQTEALRAKYGFDTPEGVKPEDMEKAARELHEIQERWKQAAEAPRAQAQTLWHRYRQAADPIQAKAREFFAQRVEERKANLERKLALIERAEALADVDRLDQDRRRAEEAAGGMAGDRPGAAPGHARHVEAVPRGLRRVLHPPQRRPRAAQGDWAANQAKKEALCARAEELAQSTRVGAGRRRDAPAAGRVEERRPGAPHQVRGALAALPAAPATRSSTATSGATRSSSKSRQADREALVAGARIAGRSGRSDESDCTLRK